MKGPRFLRRPSISSILLEIVTAIIFIAGAITIPVWVADKIRNEALTKVSSGLTPIATLTSQLIKK